MLNKDFFGSLFVCYNHDMKYEGTIVEESLLDNRFLNGLEILGLHISSAVFPGKTFRFIHSDKATWQPAVEYGRSISIPEEQLDFIIE